MKTAFLLMLIATASMVAQAAGRPAILGISHVTLRSADLSKSREFYGRVLGLAEEPAGNSHRARFRINDHQYVELIAAGADAPADRLIEVGVETKDAEAMRRYLGAHGVRVPEQVTEEKGDTRSFDVLDPEGHQICFEQFGTVADGGAPGHPISTHMIHAGFIVHDRAAEDRFYKDVLGFHVSWPGGMKNNETDWVDMQVPNGSDWLEYMLNVAGNPSPQEAGVMRHLALGVVDIKPAVKMAEQSGWPIPDPAEVGRDGKWQLNLYDPDLTRVEVMEFRPVEPPCCAKYTGRHPGGR
ncbi:MAG TPA: VOC family protein [Terriglobales bacterium]|nr:VOC family protein [Terriglobales bacterium]